LHEGDFLIVRTSADQPKLGTHRQIEETTAEKACRGTEHLGVFDLASPRAETRDELVTEFLGLLLSIRPRLPGGRLFASRPCLKLNFAGKALFLRE
jgi:hypothetical protein